MRRDDSFVTAKAGGGGGGCRSCRNCTTPCPGCLSWKWGDGKKSRRDVTS